MKVVLIALLATLVYSMCFKNQINLFNLPFISVASSAPTTEKPDSTTSATVDEKKAHLLEKAKQYEAEAEKEITKLTKEGKTAAIEVLKKDLEAVKKLIPELEAAKDKDTLKKIEKEVQEAEKKLKAQIEKDKAGDKGSTKTHVASSPKPTPTVA